ncbi:amino acid adenylation domain-containing protein [Pseudomonas purpurea]|uniref:amino acid adenylation domain-containing protein n=1 Tax=Pseudomonas purpurea TaxID=3136737 RepID=UPI0032630E1A
MNADDALKLARRFIGLPLEKRRMFLAALNREGVDFAQFPIPVGVEAEDRHQLSYAQRRMWFLWQLDPQSGAYNLPGAVRLKGPLNEAALQQAFASLVARHETLRTAFQRQDDERIVQVPIAAALTVQRADFSTLPVAERERAVMGEVEQQSLQAFDLACGPLLRVKLLRLDAEEHVLLLTLHHIVSDGWSMNVLIDEFIRCYDAHDRGDAPDLPPLAIQYSDYALWQRRWLEAGEQDRQLDYWMTCLGSEHPVLELPTDHPRPAMPSYRGTRHEFELDSALAEQLRATAKQHNITLFMLLLGAFNILLQRYTGQSDIRIGVPIANRNRSEIEGLIGFFVNTQVLRVQLNGQTRVDALLRDVKEAALGAQAHQDLPFEQLVEALKLERSLSHTPLFQVMYNHQPHVADITAVTTASGLQLSAVDWQGRTTQFDLTLDTYERGGQLHAALTYASDLFDAATIARMAEHWKNLLRSLIRQPDAAIGELSMLADEEYQCIVHDWNQATALAEPGTLQQLFEAQVQRTPQALALIEGHHEYNYAQVNARANQLAHYLRERGVVPGVLVAIAMPRTLDLLTGLLAILKAGGGYVPLDPDYPAERLAYMLEDCGARWLLSHASLQALLPEQAGVERLFIDEQAPLWQVCSPENPELLNDPRDLAYVIYTSGSTGRPKGVSIEHRNTTALIDWARQVYSRDDLSGVLAATSVCFDLSVWEFFVTLSCGGFLIIVDNVLALAQLPARERVRLINSVPSAATALLAAEAIPTSVRIINLAGEALKQSVVDGLYALPHLDHVYDLYGPSEDTTYSTYTLREAAGRASIGRPLNGTRSYVLDEQGHVVPVGVVGELYLAGVGLTRGYLNRAGLTAERYLPDPFDTAGGRAYRTGDLARYRADGVIEYVGRIDHQVKVRGFRIELGEIEAKLLEHSVVLEAAVLAQDLGQGQQLLAYVVTGTESVGAESEATLRQQLRAHLKLSLPDYMVPAQIMLLAHLPLTPNGKLDRKALPQPQGVTRDAEFCAPLAGVEAQLAQIWQSVLGVEQVGRQDNFFELGGDSIISLQIVSRARQAGINLSPKDIFQYQTVESLAAVAGQTPLVVQEQGLVSGDMPLMPVQAWFFEEVTEQAQHWNQSVLLRAREPLRADLLSQALQAVYAHHDALRLGFAPGSERAQHRPLDAQAGQVMLWQRTVDSLEQVTALCDQAQASLDLQQGPLLRAVLIEAPQQQRLLLAIHHLVVDGVSWRILLEDLQRAYVQLLAGQAPQLPAKTSAFKGWAERLHAYAGEPAVLAEQAYWQAQLGETLPTLPQDNPHGSLNNHYARRLSLSLDATQTERLLKHATLSYRTQVNDLLLTALATVLCRWTQSPSVLVQLEGHGREDLFEGLDLSRTLGWFTSLFALRLTPAAELAGSIKQIKEQVRAVPNKGLGYGVLRYLAEPSVRERMAALAEARITFNYLGQFDQSFADDALLVPSGESSGAGQSLAANLSNWLSIDGQVFEGALRLDWSYSSQMYHDETIQHLVDDMRAELLAVIEHCCDAGHHGVTPSDFPLARLTQAQLDALPLSAAAMADVYPLSPMQQGMLFHTLYEPQAGAYINQLRLDIQGLDLLAFGSAWQSAVNRHDILRSSFHWQGLDTAHQVIHRHIDVQMQVIDSPHADLDALADAERARGFELSAAPLFRLVLVRSGADGWHLIYTSHHILMDGWSNAQLLAEVIQHYAGQPLAKPQGHFRDYLGWLQQQPAAAGEQFWKSALTALEAPTLLAEALPTPVGGSGMGEHYLTLDGAETQRLLDFARQQKVTLNTVLQGAWAVLLQRYSGQECVAFGATVAGRSAPLPGIEQQLGLFINTLPIIATGQPRHSVAQWLSDLQALNLSLREHEHVPLYEIQGWAGQQGSALFDSLLVFENFPVAEALKQGAPAGLTFGALHNHEQTSYPLTLGIEVGATLSLEFSFDQALFSALQIRRLCANLLHVLEQFVAQPQQMMGAIGLLDAQARQDVLQLSRPAAPVLDSPLLAHQRFEQQAARTPDALAVMVGDERLTYAQLNARANQLAHCLRERNVAPGQTVGLSVRRNSQMIVSLLAILKAGAAYVPLDPDYPVERLGYMIEDSGIDLLLVQPGLLADVTLPEGLPCLALDLSGEALAAYSTLDPRNLASADDLAYLIYTSGSTGQPKGVSIAHAALREFCVMAADYSQIGADDRVLQFATFSFDGFVEQCYPPLCVGATLVVRGDEVWDTDTLYEQIIEHGVTLADLPAAYWYLLAQDWAANPQRDKGCLRQVHVGGEAMSLEGLKLWHAAGLGAVRLLNTYGPTEATVVSSTHLCSLDDTHNSHGVPIGRALPGRALYVLDTEGHLLPVGCVGELCIGGDAGIARQYHQRPALTAERFIADPFSTTPGARLYRSGDLARYREDGALEYLGRIDHQVKIRGFRVELGELEAHLQALPLISEAAVLVHEGAAGKQLIGYVVPAHDDTLALDPREVTHTVRRALGERLPEYMLPAQLVLMSSLPLNRNGKLDRAALPAPVLWASAGGTPPQGELETRLAAIWQEVLHVARVDREDHFFELGGHSLLATRIVSQIRQHLGLSVSLRSLFEHPRLEDFAAQVQGLQQSSSVCERPPLLPDRSGERQPLSFAQQRLWFLWSLEPDSSMYNMPGALRLRGELNSAALRQTFAALVDRHAVLRTTFYEEDGQTWQRVHPELPLSFVETDLRHLPDAQAQAEQRARDEVARPFDLRHGPLLRVHVVRVADQEHVLLLTVHHIVADDWSFRVLINEFVTLYPSLNRGETPELPAHSVQYADFAKWQRQWLEQGGELQRQLDYWQDRLGEQQVVLELPADGDQRTAQEGASEHFTFTGELSQNLRDFAQRHDLSLFMVLLAGFTLVLRQRTEVSRVRIGTDIANRNQAELEQMVGFFVNQLVLQVEVDACPDAAHLLQACRRAVLEASDHQDLPFERLVEALRLPRRAGRSPLFDIKLIYQEGVGRLPSMDSLQVEDFPSGRQAAEIGMVAAFYNDAEHIHLSFETPVGRFLPSTLECLFEQIQAVLEAVIGRHETPLDELLSLAGDVQRRADLRLSDQRKALLGGRFPIKRRSATRSTPVQETAAD